MKKILLDLLIIAEILVTVAATAFSTMVFATVYLLSEAISVLPNELLKSLV